MKTALRTDLARLSESVLVAGTDRNLFLGRRGEGNQRRLSAREFGLLSNQNASARRSSANESTGLFYRFSSSLHLGFLKSKKSDHPASGSHPILRNDPPELTIHKETSFQVAVAN